MDSQDFRGLCEAYAQVYTSQEIDEAVRGESSERREALAAERRSGIKPLSAKEGEKYASHKLSQMAYSKRKRMGEEFDIFDVVLEFLQVEGYVETLEEAEWMMANLIDEEAVAIILGENRRAARDAGGYKDDSKKQPDPSKPGFTGMGNMSIDQIRKMSARIKKEKEQNEEYVDEASSRDDFTRAAIARNAGRRKGGITFEPGPNWDSSANYGKGANLSSKQKEKQRRKSLRQEDFESWVNELVKEGYNLSEYTWDDMYEFYLDEAIYSEKGKAKAAELIAKRSTPSGRAKSGQGSTVAQIKQIRGSGRGDFDKEGLGGTPMTPTIAKNPRKKQNYTGTGNKAARRAGLTPTRENPNAWKVREEFESWLDEAMTNYEKNRRRAAQRAAARNEARARGQTGNVPGVGYVTPRKERETWTDESGKTRHAKGL